MIDRLADRGVAVLVTTHYLEEAEQCNRLGLMVAGELVAQGTPTEIKAAQQGHLIELNTKWATTGREPAQSGNGSVGAFRCSEIACTSLWMKKKRWRRIQNLKQRFSRALK